MPTKSVYGVASFRQGGELFECGEGSDKVQHAAMSKVGESDVESY